MEGWEVQCLVEGCPNVRQRVCGRIHHHRQRKGAAGGELQCGRHTHVLRAKFRQQTTSSFSRSNR